MSGKVSSNVLYQDMIQLNKPNRILANKEGMALALEFQDLRDELQALRIHILDDWPNYPTNEKAHGYRKVIAHGGNIVADMKTIAFMAERNAG